MAQRLDDLDKEVSRFKLLSLEESTKRSYASHRAAYQQFCDKYKFAPIPVSPLQMARYVAYLSTKLAASSIPKYLNIIRIMHLEIGLPDPGVLHMHQVSEVLKGVEKEKGLATKRMKPISPNILLAIRSKLYLSALSDAALWAAMLLGFCGLLRRSNLFPPSISGFQPDKHLSWSQVTISPSQVVIALPWSKTNQCKERVIQKYLLAVPGHPMCPVMAFTRLLDLTPSDIPPSSPVFWRQGHNGLTPILYGWFSDRFKSLLSSVVPDSSLYGSHSLRRGGASWALVCGLPSDAIRILGDWRSDAYMDYLDLSPSQSQQYMRQFQGALPKSF